jgi:hypothetical protein
MANRSDFLSALPRQYKRMIAMGVARGYIEAKDEGTVRAAFVVAHRAHKSFKLKRNLDPNVKQELKAVADAEKADAEKALI